MQGSDPFGLPLSIKSHLHRQRVLPFHPRSRIPFALAQRARIITRLRRGALAGFEQENSPQTDCSTALAPAGARSPDAQLIGELHGWVVRKVLSELDWLMDEIWDGCSLRHPEHLGGHRVNF